MDGFTLSNAFNKSLERTNYYLKLIGFRFDVEDSKRSVSQRLRNQWRFVIHVTFLNVSILGEFLWLIEGIAMGKSLLEFTYFIPCLTLCLLGIFKMYYFVIYEHYVNELIDRLGKWHAHESAGKRGDNWVRFLATVLKILLFSEAQCVLAFALGPLVVSGMTYYKTGEVKFSLPFFIWYPFDALTMTTWPLVYFHQLWSAWVVILSVYSADCFFLTCCTFICIKFTSLHHDMEDIIRVNESNVRFKAELITLVNRHRELIRCVEVLEIIYSKSTLFNVLTSSLIICATGFNLMAFNDFTLAAPFTGFLTFSLLQIYLYCYFGDNLITCSTGISDAIYNCRWFESTVGVRKYLLIILTRAQKPCKITAYGFADINLAAFTKILSTSWSYFALLRQMFD